LRFFIVRLPKILPKMSLISNAPDLDNKNPVNTKTPSGEGVFAFNLIWVDL